MIGFQMCRNLCQVFLFSLLVSASFATPGQTLGAAVLRGDNPQIIEALQRGEDVNAKNAFGVSLFVSACTLAPISTIKLLLANGANVDLQNPLNGQTPLMLVIRRFGDIQASKTILAMGADVNARSKDGWTAFMDAVSAPNNALEIATLLIEAGAKIDAKTENGSTALFWTKDTAISRLLQSRGADIDAQDSAGDTPLFVAVNYGRESMVKQLIDSGAKINAKNRQGETAFLRALKAEGGNSTGEFVLSEMLLLAGSNVNIADTKGETPLMHAVKEIDIGQDSRDARQHVVQQLITKGANVNRRANNGTTALMRSASAGNSDMVKLLLQHGANPNIADNDGSTALFWALGNGMPRYRNATLMELIKGGADTDIKQKNGKTVFDLAESEVALEIKKYLEAKGK
ncbi:MAG: ankyrin repeat domain-containing protein [Rhodoferax sp.]